jgi:outer membrane protein assembly factor BamB
MVPDVRLEANWSLHPPRELWRIPAGAGWSGFAVVDGIAVTHEQEGPQEVVSAFDASSGQRLWRHSHPARYATTIAGEGPRATPAIDDGRVYAVGATGWLTCVDLRTGRLVWERDAVGEYGGVVPEWGYSVSPLVVGDQVILSVGGTEGRSLVAMDRETGQTLWGGGTDRASYSSPIFDDSIGRGQILVFNHSSVAGHDPETGALLWDHPYASGHVHVAAPLVLARDRVLVSSGYGHGSECYSLHHDPDNGWSAELEWKSRRMKAKFTNLVLQDGHVFGLDDGILACISAETGEQQWKDGRYGHGQVLLAGEHLLVLAETGELVLVDPSPQELNELARVEVFSGKTWNPPALAGRYLFLRTDSEAVCLELALSE